MPFASTIIGTYGYMAPEQFQGAASHASDLYSIGGTLLYLLTGLVECPEKEVLLVLTYHLQLMSATQCTVQAEQFGTLCPSHLVCAASATVLLSSFTSARHPAEMLDDFPRSLSRLLLGRYLRRWIQRGICYCPHYVNGHLVSRLYWPVQHWQRAHVLFHMSAASLVQFVWLVWMKERFFSCPFFFALSMYLAGF